MSLENNIEDQSNTTVSPSKIGPWPVILLAVVYSALCYVDMNSPKPGSMQTKTHITAGVHQQLTSQDKLEMVYRKQLAQLYE